MLCIGFFCNNNILLKEVRLTYHVWIPISIIIMMHETRLNFVESITYGLKYTTKTWCWCDFKVCKLMWFQIGWMTNQSLNYKLLQEVWPISPNPTWILIISQELHVSFFKSSLTLDSNSKLNQIHDWDLIIIWSSIGLCFGYLDYIRISTTLYCL
jgi:hypothetical protein